MLDHALESAFVAVLRPNPLFAGVYFFTGHDDEEHQLPGVTVSSKSESLAGSAVVFRAELTILVETEAHDSTPSDHAALVEKVRARLADKATVAATINAARNVYLYGYAFAATNPDVDGIRFRTALTLKAGYGTARN